MHMHHKQRHLAGILPTSYFVTCCNQLRLALLWVTANPHHQDDAGSSLKSYILLLQLTCCSCCITATISGLEWLLLHHKARTGASGLVEPLHDGCTPKTASRWKADPPQVYCGHCLFRYNIFFAEIAGRNKTRKVKGTGASTTCRAGAGRAEV